MHEPGQDHRQPAVRGERHGPPQAREHPSSRYARPGAVLRRLRHRPARRASTARARLRRRPRGDDDDRPRAPGQGARGDREGPRRRRRAGGRAGRDRPADRRRASDVRRHELPAKPVQPRHPGRAAAGLVVQADRARERVRQGIAPSTRFTSKPIEIDAGDRIWKVSNYEDTYLGRVDLARAMVSSDNSVYAQLTKIVGPKAIVETARGSASAPSCPRTSRSASAPSPSTRST